MGEKIKSSVHECLGIEMINEICKKYGLNFKEKKIIEEILEEWDKFLGQIEMKTTIAMEKMKNTTKKKQIISALLEINVIFMKKRSKLKQ